MTDNSYIISFDLDDTLFDNGPVIIHAFKKLYEHMVASYAGFADLFDFEQFVNLAHQSRLANPEIVDYSLLRKIHIQKSLDELGVSDTNPEIAYEVFINARQEVVLFDETIAMLDSLKSHPMHLIAISNGNADPDRIGLSGYFSHRYNPTSVGYAKPDPRMYESVCNELDILPSQLIHIGDCLDNDVKAAQEAGCHAIWFNRLNHDGDHALQINNLNELKSEILKIITN